MLFADGAVSDAEVVWGSDMLGIRRPCLILNWTTVAMLTPRAIDESRERT